MSENNVHTYDDILLQPHPVSNKHPHMAQLDRAAQFAPFAALSGHKEAVYETQRLTEEKRILDEYQKNIINDVLQEIQRQRKETPCIKIIHFKEDITKCGGAYLHDVKMIKKIDEYHRMLVCMDRTTINIDDIYHIEILDKNEESL